jgi:DNA-binding Xre family transcriptional regulator
MQNDFDAMVEIHKRLAQISLDTAVMIKERKVELKELAELINTTEATLKRKLASSAYNSTLEELALLSLFCGYQMKVTFEKVEK